MKILAIEKEIKGIEPSKMQPHLKNEARAVWKLQQAGIIREIYFTQKSHCAVIILECGSAPDAMNILNSLPLVKENLISFDVIPLVPYDGFERLFNNK